MGWAAELWADEHERRDTPPADPQPVDAKIGGRWADLLEERARRCQGCGEWTFTTLCDWCLDAWSPHDRTGRECYVIVDPKAACPGCVAVHDADGGGRWPVGYCGPDCLRKPAASSSDPQARAATVDNVSAHTDERSA